ncbi:MAG TPA: ComEC/Rec2 family competence protein [Actinomycetota bacterium]|nr:ComEC/Rec2 family competence protein [Actinomycetota bacterium]
MGGLARVWLCLAGLVTGVCSTRVRPGAVVLVAAAGIALALRRRGLARPVGLVALSFAAGAVAAAVRAPEGQPVAALARTIPSCRVAGRTLEEAGGLGLLAAVDAAGCRGRPPVADAGVVFVDDLELEPGRRFTAEGWLIPLGDEPFERARARAGAGAAFRAVTGRDEGPLPGLHSFAGRVREGLAAAAAPLGRAGGLLRGLTIGDTSGIDPATEDALRRSGLAHLLAVSGSNVALLLGAVAFALRTVPLVAKVAACAAALVLFVAVVGPDASVLRAAGMGVVALVALATGRRPEPLHALGLALVAVVALRPGIVFSTGLHLSVAATLGIVLWTGPVSAHLRRLPRAVATPFAATVAAQAAVTPLLAGVFGTIPFGGLPANLLALPAVAPATMLGLLAGAVSPWSEPAAAALARAAAPFAAWVLWIGGAFGGPGWAPPVPRALGAWLAAPVVVAAAWALVHMWRPPRKLTGDGPLGRREVG